MTPGFPSSIRFLQTAFVCIAALVFPGRLLSEEAHTAPEESVQFARDVRPILEQHCFGCHGAEKQRSGLRLDLRGAALAGGESGPVILPGNSPGSALLQWVRGETPETRMPPEGEPLSPTQIALLSAWIDLGASWPEDADDPEPITPHWSLQPLRLPPLPAPREMDWVRTPVDRFILTTLEANNLSPSPPADRRTLLRRVYFNLTGLPPSGAELEAFLADESAEAYSRVVDHLLASPRYGERWARHWMDVVHFAETHGHDQDRIRTNAWPYRDYLIRSFNEDKPYSRFVREQLAGDVLFPEDPQATVALGFIAAGPWDESSLRDIREDTVDRQIGRYLDRDDMLATTFSTFTSSTVHCARCHNHKFDPISQREYYNLQAVFAGVDRANRAYDDNPETHLRRQQLMVERRKLERGDPDLRQELLTSRVQDEVGQWAVERAGRAAVWTVLQPHTLTSSGGATLVQADDASILATGALPEKDTYTLAARALIRGITAVRLEALTDASLPGNGPGRRENGNFHLSEFKLFVRTAEGESKDRAVALRNPTSSFDQAGWTIRHALDGVGTTAWGIHPQVGRAHEAVFELETPLTLEAGATLVFHLEQLHGESHLIGRLRLSATDAPEPPGVDPLPPHIAAALSLPVGEWSSEQKLALAVYHFGKKIERELASLPAPQWVYAAASDFVPDGGLVPSKSPRPVHLLRRGDIHRPGDLALPGALSAVPDLPSSFELPDLHEEGLRRAALANWITDPRNSLAWRSIVNRVWHYHFGRGLVETPNDFGRMGGLPSHPELLDWLAIFFMETGGSIKQLHRLILNSAVYQQSSKHRADAATLDSGNVLLWRMNRARLDAESLRDTVLEASGMLDLAMGGPSVQHFVLSPGIHVTPNVDYTSYDFDRPESFRRSVYRFLFRTLPDPLMDALDCPDGSQLTPVRTPSFNALQALAMLNNEFMVRQSEHLAGRVARMAGDVDDQIRTACELALGRAPVAAEMPEWLAYVGKHGLANFCRVLLNSNEFMFVN